MATRSSCSSLRNNKTQRRAADIREDDQLDEAQMATWIRQAAALARLGPIALAGTLSYQPSLTRPSGS
jgi:hypothetical protein